MEILLVNIYFPQISSLMTNSNCIKIHTVRYRFLIILLNLWRKKIKKQQKEDINKYVKTWGNLKMHPDSRLKKNRHKIGPVAMASVRTWQVSSKEKHNHFSLGWVKRLELVYRLQFKCQHCLTVVKGWTHSDSVPVSRGEIVATDLVGSSVSVRGALLAIPA